MYATAVTKMITLGGATGRAVPGQDFLTVLNAAYHQTAAKPVVSVWKETRAEEEISPMERYQAVTGRSVKEREPVPVVQDRWRDEALAHYTVGQFTGRWDAPIDTTNTINWESLGDHKLTAEEIEQLKGKYDVKNLTAQEYYDLMSELTHMEVLSGNDVMGVHFATAGSEAGFDTTSLFTGAAGPVEGQFQGDIVNYFAVAVSRLLASWKWINSNEYKAANAHVSAEKQKMIRSATLKDLRPRQKMLDVLTLLQ